jgi:hypothetical protein
MKIILTTFFCLLLFSCNNKGDKNPIDSASPNGEKRTSSSSKTEVDTKDGLSLPQHGDYSTLFNLQKGDCSFITEADIATALSVPEDAIQFDSKYDRCNYEITLDDASKWTVSLQWHAFSKDQITREIKNYTEEGSPLIALISETKDTYLGIHPFNKFLMVLNNNYDGTIQISYCQTACRKLSKEEKEVRKQLAITLSNYLLKKHKN